MINEKVAAEIGVSPAALYNWRNQYRGMSVADVKELKTLRDENVRIKRLTVDLLLEVDGLTAVA